MTLTAPSAKLTHPLNPWVRDLVAVARIAPVTDPCLIVRVIVSSPLGFMVTSINLHGFQNRQGGLKLLTYGII